ncbi:hypothetical protein ACFUTR_20215 [Streptomyces sp. NPDC057367]|uniref:hypothetical protein n=1 Tax=Streptomyces sp. NPDC057367 TaxID=3346108 RepID=UPI0036291E79
MPPPAISPPPPPSPRRLGAGPPSCPATGINEQAVISYLVTADCTAAALLPDVLGVMTEADRG